MKVLHLNTATYGGAATGMLRQHFSLLKAGVDSNVLTALSNGSSLQKVFTHNQPPVKSPVIRLANRFNLFKSAFESERANAERLGRPFHQGGTFELFSSPYSDYKVHEHPLVEAADLINLHWISGFVDIPSFLENVRKPIVWTLHDMNPYLGGFHYDVDALNNPQFDDLDSRYKRIKQTALENVKYAVIGNSKWNTQKSGAGSIFRRSSFTDTIYYPLNEEQFFGIDKSLAKTALNLPKHKFVIGFASEDINNPRKGFADLSQAIQLLSESTRKRLHCLTFGGNKALDQNGSEISYTQMGPVNNTRVQSIIYSAMDAFIIPSKAEAFGLTALEAMACKTPVIGYNTGGIPEMVKNNSTGILVNDSNIRSLYESIMKMINLNVNERQNMGTNAHELVNNQHNSHAIGMKYLKVYESLV